MTAAADKCKVLVIGDKRVKKVTVQGRELAVEGCLRFLGIKIRADGTFAPWKEGFDVQLSALWQRIKDVGLNQYPSALVKAY